MKTNTFIISSFQRRKWREKPFLCRCLDEMREPFESGDSFESLPVKRKRGRPETQRIPVVSPQETPQIPSALEELARYIASESLVSKRQMESNLRLGVPFRNTFAALEPGKSEVVCLDYDETFFNLHVLPVDYKPVQAEGDGLYLQKVSRLFLKNLAGGCQTKLNILRGFGRNLITAPRDGTRYQTALWVHGPPATMKSTWTNVLKLLVDPRFVQEQVIQMTPFSAGQLESCQLLILSNMQTISKDMVGLLKVIIGRDPIPLKQKDVQEISIIQPYCQVIIVSNYPPSHFPEVYNDEGMMSRLIPVEFTDKDRIPQELQISNVIDHVKPLMSDIFNWFAHAPAELSRYYIRSHGFKQHIHAAKPKEVNGFAAFVEEKFVYDEAKEAFVSHHEVYALLQEYVDETCDPILEDFLKRKMMRRQIGKILPIRVREAFGLKIVSTRWSTRRPYAENVKRPFGFAHLMLKKQMDGKVILSETQSEFKQKYETHYPTL